MANKRDTASQRRARENRARRQALEARTKGAPVRPSRVAPSTAEKLAKAPAEKGAKSADDGGAQKGTGKPRRERPPRPGDRPVDIATLEGSWFKKVIQVPGGLQVLMAVMLTIFVSAMAAFTSQYVDRDAPKDAKPTQTIFEAYPDGATAAILLAVPILVVGAAAAASLTKHRRRVWLAAAVFMGVICMQWLFLNLFPAGALAWAYFRANKIEGPAEPLIGRRRKQRAEGSQASEESPAEDAETAAKSPVE